jgi:hypothetical protein
MLVAGCFANTVTLLEQGTQKLTVTYLAAQESEKIRLEFEAKLDAVLQNDKAVTVYCMKALDSSFAIKDGVETPAFGFSFI